MNSRLRCTKYCFSLPISSNHGRVLEFRRSAPYTIECKNANFMYIRHRCEEWVTCKLSYCNKHTDWRTQEYSVHSVSQSPYQLSYIGTVHSHSTTPSSVSPLPTSENWVYEMVAFIRENQPGEWLMHFPLRKRRMS